MFAGIPAVYTTVSHCAPIATLVRTRAAFPRRAPPIHHTLFRSVSSRSPVVRHLQRWPPRTGRPPVGETQSHTLAWPRLAIVNLRSNSNPRPHRHPLYSPPPFSLRALNTFLASATARRASLPCARRTGSRTSVWRPRGATRPLLLIITSARRIAKSLHKTSSATCHTFTQHLHSSNTIALHRSPPTNHRSRRRNHPTTQRTHDSFSP
jgi:hypothetical protein